MPDVLWVDSHFSTSLHTQKSSRIGSAWSRRIPDTPVVKHENGVASIAIDIVSARIGQMRLLTFTLEPRRPEMVHLGNPGEGGRVETHDEDDLVLAGAMLLVVERVTLEELGPLGAQFCDWAEAAADASGGVKGGGKIVEGVEGAGRGGRHAVLTRGCFRRLL